MWYRGTSPAAAITAVLLTLAAAACGSDLGAEPDVAILSTLSVSPSTATLFTVAPSNSVKLTYEAKDQRGDLLSGATVSFSTDNQQVAQVDASGMIQARGVGTANVTTSLTLNGVTRSAQTAITVVEAPESAVVDAPERTFAPTVAHVRAGGRVTWRMGDVPHDVVFTTAGAPVDIPRSVNVSESRTFPDNGTFAYECTLHAGMRGSVEVH